MEKYLTWHGWCHGCGQTDEADWARAVPRHGQNAFKVIRFYIEANSPNLPPSFLLDLHTDECDCSFIAEKPEKETVDSKLKKAFTPMKKTKPKGVMDGVPLTQEGVCQVVWNHFCPWWNFHIPCISPTQVYQIIEFLGRPHNITTEGIFRKHGNLKKQQVSIYRRSIFHINISPKASFHSRHWKSGWIVASHLTWTTASFRWQSQSSF